MKAPHRTFVGSDQDEQVTLIAAQIEQRMMKVFVGSLRELAQHFRHLVRKRTRRHDAILRASELRGRHHLHGLGDLLRVLYRLNAPANVEKIRHRVNCYAGCAAAVEAAVLGQRRSLL